MTGITKRFPGVLALDGVNLVVREGEVHALLGENGAGKSTLVKILAGAYTKDAGEIEIFSRKLEIDTPRRAEALGISIIYQELNLVGALSVAENIFMGRLKTSGIHVKWAEINREAERLLRDLEIDIDVRRPVRDLGIAQQQMVEVAKALSKEARIIIMDEPTAPLTNRETENLFRVIRKLRDNRVSVIYISHRLEEVKEICDRATIMRDGRTIIEAEVPSLSMDDIIRYMVGREIREKYPRIEKTIGEEEILRVENLSSGDKVKEVGFAVHAGEILGIGGLVGAGRTEMARALFKLDPNTGGKVYIRGRLRRIQKPRDAIAAGIGFLTEDRKGEGLVLKMSVGKNITLPTLKNFTRLFHLDHGKEQKSIGEYVGRLAIKTPSSEQLANNISGGNQQKIVLAKWMLSRCDVLIFDEPTRGIDVGAKIEVYNIINQLAKEGKAILVITSEIPELLGISDRVLVMARGRISGELKREEATQEAVMALATGIALSG
jgi:ribose transport system ATP-binding protein